MNVFIKIFQVDKISCGIVSYIGNQDPVPILIKGLRRLEYRGYDSAGLARWKES